MARLNLEQKRFAVRAIAQTGSFESAHSALLEEFPKAPELAGLTPQHLEVYAPYTKAGARLSDELKDLFWEERAKVVARIERIRIASREERLLHLERMVFDPDPDAPPLTMKMVLMAFSHAAKELGGMFERPVDGLTDEDVAAIVERRMERTKAVIAEHVTDPEVRERVCEAIKKAAAGPADGAGGGGG